MNPSIFKRAKAMFVAGALAISCVGFAAVGFAEAKAISLNDYFGSYVRSQNFAGVNFSANMHGNEDQTQSYAEFVVLSEDGKNGGMNRIAYIGEITKGESGSNHYFHISHVAERYYDNQGELKNYSVDNTKGYGFRLLYRTEDAFVLADDGGKAPRYDITGEYNRENPQQILSQDVAVYLLEMHANSSPEIPLQPWRHQYKYVTTKVDNDVIFRKIVEKEGRHWCGGVIVEAYTKDGEPMGNFFVTNDGQNIILLEKNMTKIVWSTEAVG